MNEPSRPGRLHISLDYDNTYSADPELWNGFILSARLRGHDVRIVTARDDRYDRTAPLVELEKAAPVIYTRGIAKGWYLRHFGGDFIPSIFIDDKPESILGNSPTSVEDLAAWRIERGEGQSIPC